jgi:hypothetical protein
MSSELPTVTLEKSQAVQYDLSSITLGTKKDGTPRKWNDVMNEVTSALNILCNLKTTGHVGFNRDKRIEFQLIKQFITSICEKTESSETALKMKTKIIKNIIYYAENENFKQMIENQHNYVLNLFTSNASIVEKLNPVHAFHYRYITFKILLELLFANVNSTTETYGIKFDKVYVNSYYENIVNVLIDNVLILFTEHYNDPLYPHCSTIEKTISNYEWYNKFVNNRCLKCIKNAKKAIIAKQAAISATEEQRTATKPKESVASSEEHLYCPRCTICIKNPTAEKHEHVYESNIFLEKYLNFIEQRGIYMMHNEACNHIANYTFSKFVYEKLMKENNIIKKFGMERYSEEINKKLNSIYIFQHDSISIDVIQVMMREFDYVYRKYKSDLPSSYFEYINEIASRYNSDDIFMKFGVMIKSQLEDDFENAFKIFSETKSSDLPEKLLFDELSKSYLQYYNLVTKEFNKNKILYDAIKSCCIQSFNAQIDRQFDVPTDSGMETQQKKVSFIAFLVHFCDAVCRNEYKDIDETKIFSVTQCVAHFTMYIVQKDIFMDIYKTYFFKRVINNKSVLDFELAFINQFKKMHGAYFTRDYESILSAVQKAEDENRAFNEICNTSSTPLNGKLNVIVLQSNIIGAERVSTMELHHLIKTNQMIYENCFKKIHQSKKLTWSIVHGHITIDCDFKLGKKLVTMTITQANLLLFLNTSELSVGELCRRANVDINTIKAYLSVMYSGKGFNMLLRKTNTGEVIDNKGDLAPTDIICINTEFKHKQRTYSFINQARRYSSPQEDDETTKKVNATRAYQIDAAIVRIMKSRKTLHSSDLMSEVTIALEKYTVPDTKLIKKRIEELITREYLVRDEENTGIFHYKA